MGRWRRESCRTFVCLKRRWWGTVSRTLLFLCWAVSCILERWCGLPQVSFAPLVLRVPLSLLLLSPQVPFFKVCFFPLIFLFFFWPTSRLKTAHNRLLCVFPLFPFSLFSVIFFSRSAHLLIVVFRRHGIRQQKKSLHHRSFLAPSEQLLFFFFFFL